MPRYYTSGRWTVKEGHEQAFRVAFEASGVDDVDPPIRGLVERPRLLQDLSDRHLFLSYAVWDSREAIHQFRSRPDFPEMIARMREHLDDMQISTLVLVVGVDQKRPPRPPRGSSHPTATGHASEPPPLESPAVPMAVD
jgi:heme-degrading monooxygenase HmoA